jgi:hypothetical protein
MADRHHTRQTIVVVEHVEIEDVARRRGGPHGGMGVADRLRRPERHQNRLDERKNGVVQVGRGETDG